MQANINSTLVSPMQIEWNDIIFCNEGGKDNMSYLYRNIPPIEATDLPTEMWVRNTLTGDLLYKKILCYDKDCQSSLSCHSEVPMFRFQIVYDGFDFIYYPELKLYERPYILLEGNYPQGTDEINLSSVTPAKNYNRISVGDTLTFIDYGDDYVVAGIEISGSTAIISFSEQFDKNYYKNDMMVVKSLKYDSPSDSNLMEDNSSISPFKFKFIDIANTSSKTYKISHTLGVTGSSVLTNDNYNSVLDIWGTLRYASISQDLIIEKATLQLDSNLTDINFEITFTSDILNYLQVNSLFTLEDRTNDKLEILEVIEIVDSNTIKVARGKHNTQPQSFSSATTDIYFPKYEYFILIPCGFPITSRYVLYRNIDFVLTWV